MNLTELLPTPKELEKELNKLPYTKGVDDGQYNEGVIDGFELGFNFVINYMIEKLKTCYTAYQQTQKQSN